mgnify:CR=1 FL=1
MRFIYRWILPVHKTLDDLNIYLLRLGCKLNSLLSQYFIWRKHLVWFLIIQILQLSEKYVKYRGEPLIPLFIHFVDVSRPYLRDKHLNLVDSNLTDKNEPFQDSPLGLNIVYLQIKLILFSVKSYARLMQRIKLLLRHLTLLFLMLLQKIEGWNLINRLWSLWELRRYRLAHMTDVLWCFNIETIWILKYVFIFWCLMMSILLINIHFKHLILLALCRVHLHDLTALLKVLIMRLVIVRWHHLMILLLN